LSELSDLFGNIIYARKQFKGNLGGADDPDSIRGFGSTSQIWQAPTTNGWTVRHEDNPFIVRQVTDPEGNTWYFEHQQWVDLAEPVPYTDGTGFNTRKKETFLVKGDPDAQYHY